MHEKRVTERFEAGKSKIKPKYRSAKPCAWCGRRTSVLTEKDELFFHSTACFHSYCLRFGMPLKFRRAH
jgi:hypothetical protein